MRDRSDPAVMTGPTLAAFLRARWDEDEAVARAAPDVYACWSGAETDQDLTTVGHIAPGRLLADLASKRKIAELHTDAALFTEDDGFPARTGLPVGDCPDCRQSQPCDTLRLLAEPYASHPEFRPEWAL